MNIWTNQYICIYACIYTSGDCHVYISCNISNESNRLRIKLHHYVTSLGYIISVCKYYLIQHTLSPNVHSKLVITTATADIIKFKNNYSYIYKYIYIYFIVIVIFILVESFHPIQELK